MSVSKSGTHPVSIIYALRIEGLAAFLAALAAFQILGGNWWIFALLFLLPDISMLGMLLGPNAGARAYNIAHTYTVPAVVAAVGWMLGSDWVLLVALIWVAHIGLDRGIGYGLKYPASFRHTHLGTLGKGQAKGPDHANAS